MKNNAPGPTEPGYCSSYVPSTLISYSTYCKGNLLRLPTVKGLCSSQLLKTEIYKFMAHTPLIELTALILRNHCRETWHIMKKKKKVFFFFKVGLLSNTDRKERKKERYLNNLKITAGKKNPMEQVYKKQMIY